MYSQKIKFIKAMQILHMEAQITIIMNKAALQWRVCHTLGIKRSLWFRVPE